MFKMPFDPEFRKQHETYLQTSSPNVVQYQTTDGELKTVRYKRLRNNWNGTITIRTWDGRRIIVHSSNMTVND